MMNAQTFDLSPSLPPRILIVDDEGLVGELLLDMLRLMGFAPVYCNSPARALCLIGGERFDVILSDYRMPEMSGEEFYREVLMRDSVSAERMIFLTGDAASEDTAFFLRSTGNLHLAKPFHFNRVKQILDEAIERVSSAVYA